MTKETEGKSATLKIWRSKVSNTNLCLFFLLTSFFLFCNQAMSQTAVAPAAGDGSLGNPYQIATLENLYWITESNTRWGFNYIQTADIDASPTANWLHRWKPIGLGGSFSGTYDGNFYIISNLNLKDRNKSGLFSFLSSGSKIKNLGIINISNINNYPHDPEYFAYNEYNGSIAGWALGASIENCYATGYVYGATKTGGLIGYGTDTQIKNCYSGVNCNGFAEPAGGLAGYLHGTMTNCYNIGQCSRGLIGSAHQYTDVINSFWDIETSGTNVSAGGIGLTTSEMKCFFTFFSAGWDFIGEEINGTNYIWGIDETGEQNQGYPFLAWQGFNHNARGVVESLTVSNISSTSSMVSGNIIYLGTSPTFQHGVCWNTIGSPTIDDFKTEEGAPEGTGTFSSELFGLTPNDTRYYVRTYLINEIGISYGEELDFATTPIETIQPSGSGTPDDPFEIANLNNLMWLVVNAQEWDKNYIQTDNIDASITPLWYDYAGWLPIGTSQPGFSGTYNGQGYKISNLFINRNADNIGLFSFNSGTINNLGIKDINVTGKNNVGGLVGQNTGTLSNCYSTGEIIATENNAGGLVGNNTSSSSGLVEKFSLNDNKSEKNNAETQFPWSETFDGTTFPPSGWSRHNLDGGGSQWERSTQYNHNPGGSASALHSDAPENLGNQDGWLISPQIQMPMANMNLTFWSRNTWPTFYGKNSVLISTGSSDPLSGDFVEVWTTQSVTQDWVQFTIDLISFHGKNIYIAFRYEGTYAHLWYLDNILIVEIPGYVRNSYSIANVNGQNQIGGLVGKGGSVFSSYSAGQVSGIGTNVGGLIGSGKALDSFWDIETSNQATSGGGTGKTTAQMKSVATFTNLTTVGLSSPWDFVGNPQHDTNNEDHWDIDGINNDGYPFLSWQNFATAPTVITHAVTSITSNTAYGNGSMSDIGSPPATQHGVCWNTTGMPTTGDDKTELGEVSQPGSFTSQITGLSPNNQYFVRAYATNGAGTVYGDQVQFTTKAVYSLTITLNGSGTVYVNGVPYSQVIDFPEDTQVTISAVASSGWQFNNWGGDINSNQPVENVLINNNKSISANFTQDNTSIGENAVSELMVFPNPFSNNLYFQNTGTLKQIIISNLLGKQIKKYEPKGKDSFYLSTGDWPIGLYLIRLVWADGTITYGKIMKN